MRTGKLILGVVALLWGFVQAPFDHIHPEELEHAVTTSPVHIHEHESFTERAPSIASRTDDDDEVDVLWSIATSALFVLHADLTLGERISVPTPSQVSVVVLIPEYPGHDPPEFAPTIPRAPPV